MLLVKASHTPRAAGAVQAARTAFTALIKRTNQPEAAARVIDLLLHLPSAPRERGSVARSDQYLRTDPISSDIHRPVA